MNAKYVMCIDNENYPLDLTVHKVYKVIPDGDAERLKMVRIIDDSGEDYMHPISRFLPVELSEEAKQTFEMEIA